MPVRVEVPNPEESVHAARTLVAVLLLLVPALPALAQEDPPASSSPDRAELEAALSEFEGSLDTNSTLDEKVRSLLNSSIREARASLERAAEFSATAERRREEVENAPALADALRQQIEDLSDPPEEVPGPGADTEEVESALEQAEAELAAARADEERIEEERLERDARRPAIANRLAEIESAQLEVEDRISALRATSSSAPWEESELLGARARRAELDAQAAALVAERESYDARQELLQLRRERALARIEIASNRVDVLSERVRARRRAEANRAAAEAEARREEIRERFPDLGSLAKEVEKLAARRVGDEGVEARLREAREKSEQARVALERIRSSFSSILRKVRAIGLTDRMAQVLRLEFDKLEFTDTLSRELEALREELGEIQFDLIVLEERRSAASNITADLEEVLRDVGLDPSDPANREIRGEAEELLRTRLDLLEALISDLRSLSAFDATRAGRLGERIELNRKYREYIAERVLWVPSVTLTAKELVPELREGVRWSIDAESWGQGWRASLGAVRRSWLWFGLLGLTVGTLIATRRRLDRRAKRWSEQVRHHSTDRFALTWGELGVSALVAAPYPLLLFAVGRCLAAPIAQNELFVALGSGCIAAAPVWYGLEFLKRWVRPGRLAESHFRWSRDVIDRIRPAVRRMIWLIVPSLVLTVAYANQSEEAYSATLGRIAFLGIVVSVALFMWRTFHPRHGVVSEYLAKNPSSWLGRLRWVWFPLLLATPVGLGLASLAGYHYTARTLGRNYVLSVGFVGLVVLVQALLLRWLFFARRRLAVEVARQRIEAKKQETERPEGAAAEEPSVREDGGVREDEKVDIPALDAQTKELFRVGVLVVLGFGLFFIWSEVLPALRLLERLEIFPEIRWVSSERAESDALDEYLSLTERGSETPSSGATDTGGDTADEPAPSGGDGAGQGGTADAAGGGAPPDEGASGSSSSGSGPFPGGSMSPAALTGSSSGATASSGEPAHSIDLADLGLALLLLLLTIVATKNIPGLLEISVLQRLPLDRGARYAISTIVRYALMIVGASLAFSALGIGWARVQWLAAAFTFGIAFGLQEIFANFISGLIILIERPIRVGDIVTVSEIEGRVTKLQMRATTIVDWDRSEFLVPNKEFITGSLINWTLSDSVSRLVIPVGIAYGSDVEKAHRTLLQVAKDEPRVLEDPAPSVVFRAFGASSLDFELRIFIAHRELWAGVTNAVHGAIDAAFRREGIEISFPQRDLHIRSAPALVELEKGRERSRKGEDPRSDEE